MPNNNSVPGDLELLRPWLNVARRLRESAVGSGPAIISMRVIVDEMGIPLGWGISSTVKIEPRATAVERMMALLQIGEGGTEIGV